jgi:type IV secretory pathway VirB3-like protein
MTTYPINVGTYVVDCGIVYLITRTCAIAIVVIATFYVGYLCFFSDRRTHEHLLSWLLGCIFVLGCQVLAQQFIH